MFMGHCCVPCRAWILLSQLRTALQAQNIQQTYQMDVLNGLPLPFTVSPKLESEVWTGKTIFLVQ